MKRLILVMALALAACAVQPTNQPQSAQASAFDVSVGKAYQEITLARQASTQLAVAGKITWAQDDAVQAALTALRKKFETAQQVSLTDPAQAAQLLADALNALASYEQGAKK